VCGAGDATANKSKHNRSSTVLGNPYILLKSAILKENQKKHEMPLSGGKYMNVRVNGFQHGNQEQDAHEDPETRFIITIPSEVVCELHSFQVNEARKIHEEKLRTHLSEQNALRQEIDASSNELSRSKSALNYHMRLKEN
jgi:hypothetical protein